LISAACGHRQFNHQSMADGLRANPISDNLNNSKTESRSDQSGQPIPVSQRESRVNDRFSA
jgi:hypothetical protein